MSSLAASSSTSSLYSVPPRFGKVTPSRPRTPNRNGVGMVSRGRPGHQAVPAHQQKIPIAGKSQLFDGAAKDVHKTVPGEEPAPPPPREKSAERQRLGTDVSRQKPSNNGSMLTVFPGTVLDDPGPILSRGPSPKLGGSVSVPLLPLAECNLPAPPQINGKRLAPYCRDTSPLGATPAGLKRNATAPAPWSPYFRKSAPLSQGDQGGSTFVSSRPPSKGANKQQTLPEPSMSRRNSTASDNGAAGRPCGPRNPAGHVEPRSLTPGVAQAPRRCIRTRPGHSGGGPSSLTMGSLVVDARDRSSRGLSDTESECSEASHPPDSPGYAAFTDRFLRQQEGRGVARAMDIISRSIELPITRESAHFRTHEEARALVPAGMNTSSLHSKDTAVCVRYPWNATRPRTPVRDGSIRDAFNDGSDELRAGRKVPLQRTLSVRSLRAEPWASDGPTSSLTPQVYGVEDEMGKKGHGHFSEGAPGYTEKMVAKGTSEMLRYSGGSPLRPSRSVSAPPGPTWNIVTNEDGQVRRASRESSTNSTRQQHVMPFALRDGLHSDPRFSHICSSTEKVRHEQVRASGANRARARSSTVGKALQWEQ